MNRICLLSFVSSFLFLVVGCGTVSNESSETQTSSNDLSSSSNAHGSLASCVLSQDTASAIGLEQPSEADIVPSDGRIIPSCRPSFEQAMVDFMVQASRQQKQELAAGNYCLGYKGHDNIIRPVKKGWASSSWKGYVLTLSNVLNGWNRTRRYCVMEL